MIPFRKCSECGREFTTRGPYAARNLAAHRKRHAKEARQAREKADAEFRERLRANR